MGKTLVPRFGLNRFDAGSVAAFAAEVQPAEPSAGTRRSSLTSTATIRRNAPY
jgi:hypothetical protein